jgi:hypothetical protein
MENEPGSFNGETRISRRVTFVFLAIFTFVLWACFIRYALKLTEVDVSMTWLSCYGAMLTFYATHNQLSYGWQNRKKLPGEWFVYVSWVITIVLPACEVFGFCCIGRVPANLWFYFLTVLAVYAGSRISKMLQDGMKFLGPKPSQKTP